MISRRDARTEAVVEKSRQLQIQLKEMAAELDRYVLALQVEVERLHKTEESAHE